MGVITGLVAAGVGLIGSTVQAISANQRAQGAKGDVARAKGRLKELEDSRQDIINPYELQLRVKLIKLKWVNNKDYRM